MSNRTTKFHYYSDPGHGWLKVKISLLEELGIADQISSYSYVMGEYAYLEEDADATLFMNTWRKTGRPYEFVEHCTEGDRRSTIRNYQYYSAQNIKAGRKVPKVGMKVSYGGNIYTLVAPLERGAWRVVSQFGGGYKMTRPMVLQSLEVEEKNHV